VTIAGGDHLLFHKVEGLEAAAEQKHHGKNGVAHQISLSLPVLAPRLGIAITA
jgi:hypothetical protein